MRYPNDDQIVDPLPQLPADVAQQIGPMITRAVAQFRVAADKAILADTALRIFRLLLSRRIEEHHHDVESLRRGIQADADAALACVHYVYKLAGSGRMLFIWHKEIGERLLLSEDADRVETQWWQKQAETQVPLSRPAAPPARNTGPSTSPRHGRAPDTPTARRIEEFRQKIELWGGPVQVDDMVTFCGYSDRTMFERVQREAKNATPTAKRNVERMLACPSAEEFWRVVDRNRNNPKAGHKK